MKKIKIEHRFGNHQFWENTRRKFKLPEGPLLGSIVKKWDTVVINLSDMNQYCLDLSKPFDKIYADVMSHEISHLIIMGEVETSAESEEYIISRLVDFELIEFKDIDEEYFISEIVDAAEEYTIKKLMDSDESA